MILIDANLLIYSHNAEASQHAHARVWLVLAVILPLIPVLGLVLRQGGPLEAPAVRLAAPSP